MIAVANKAEAESDAQATADLARAQAATAAEGIATARLIAEAEVDSEREKADAKKAALLAEAEGQRALHEAENTLDERNVAMREEIARIETLPKAIAEMVRRVEKIDSIKIHNVASLGGTGQGGSYDNGGTPVNQALASILGMAVQLPALKTLGDELGLSLGDGLRKIKGDAPEKIEHKDKK